MLELELEFFLRQRSDLELRTFPDWECLPYDQFSPHQDLVSRRLRALSDLAAGKPGVILLSLPNLMRRLPPPKSTSRAILCHLQLVSG